MDKKKCSKCSEEIKKDAKTCKHCGSKQAAGSCLYLVLFFAVLVGIGMLSDSLAGSLVALAIVLVLAVPGSRAFLEDKTKTPITAKLKQFWNKQPIWQKFLSGFLAVVSILTLLGGSIGNLAYNLEREPVLSIIAPEDGYSTFEDVVVIEGTVTPSDSNVSIKGHTLVINAEGEFTADFELEKGENSVTIVAQRTYTSTSEMITVIRELTEEETAEEEARIAQEKEEEEARIAQEEEEARIQKMRDYPQTYIEVVSNDWYKGGFGSIPIHTVRLKNTSEVSYKDIEIMISYFSPSGTLLDYGTYTIYDTLTVGETKTFSDINMGFINDQASSSSVDIITASTY